MAYRSRQREMGGGKFRSERQRRAIWANAPRVARRWAENQHAGGPAYRADWARVRAGAATHSSRVGRVRRSAKSVRRVSTRAGGSITARRITGKKSGWTRRGPRG